MKEKIEVWFNYYLKTSITLTIIGVVWSVIAMVITGGSIDPWWVKWGLALFSSGTINMMIGVIIIIWKGF